MGQCGCGDTVPDFQLPGPDGVTYAIQVYGSCHYCMTPVCVDVYRFGPEGAAEWVEGVPPLPFMPYDADEPTDAIATIPILDPDILAAVYAEEAENDERDGVDRVILRHVMDEAVRRTWNDNLPSPGASS